MAPEDEEWLQSPDEVEVPEVSLHMIGTRILCFKMQLLCYYFRLNICTLSAVFASMYNCTRSR